MQENPSYETDMKYAVNITRRVLNLVGAWPNSSYGFKSVLMKLLKASCLFLLYFILIPGLLRMFLIESIPRRRLKMIGPLCNCLIAISKYTILMLRGDDINVCMKYIDFDWRNVKLTAERKIMIKYGKIGRNLTIVSIVFIYASGFIYRAIAPLSRGTIVNAQNITIRPLPFAGYYIFFDPQITPAYEILFTMHFIAGCVQYCITGGVVSLTALCVLHACGQLKILKNKLENLTECPIHDINDAEKRLSLAVEHHVRIKSFLDVVERVLQYICLVEVIGCTLIMCLLGYYIIMEWEDSNAFAMLVYIILLITFIFNIFIFCFIGELLNTQGMKISTTVCTLDWYRLPNTTARSIVLFIAISNIPVKITAGKFMSLSLDNFGAIVKTSVAYLNMLRAANI